MHLLLKNSVGKKILISLTGQIMLFFVIIHMIGNCTIYFGLLNSYTEHLHALPLLLWANRVLMSIVLSLHIFFAIQMTLENRLAKPGSYAVSESLRTTFAAKNMIWTGLVIGVFLVYHLLHFTFQITNPEISAAANPDALGRPDVFSMVVRSFQDTIISFVYGIAMVTLLLHLTHGIQSSFQTLGLNNERTLPVIAMTGKLIACVIFIGFMSIPILVLAGLLKG